MSDRFFDFKYPKEYVDYVKHDIELTNALCNAIKKVNLEEERKNNTMYIVDTEYYRKQIENVVKDASIEIDCHPKYARPLVRIKGYAVENNKAAFKTGCPQCKGIIRRNNTTRVDWADGTRTVIVLEEGKEDMDMFHTFCIAFTKKMLGSTTAILNTIKECDTDAVEAARKKAIAEANKQAEEEAKAKNELLEKLRFEKAVQEKMFEERVIEEAIRRISIQEERRMNREAGEDDSEDCHGISIERFAEVFRKVMGHDKEVKESTDETRE